MRVKNKKATIIVDGSMVPDGDTSGVACLISPDMNQQIKFLSHRYDKWNSRNDRNKACEVYEKQIGQMEAKVHICGIGKGSTSTEIEKKALEFGNKIIKRYKLDKEDYTLYTDCEPSINRSDIKWIKSHMNNPAQEIVDLAAKLGNLLEAGKEVIYEGKIYDLIDLLIEELEKENEKLPEAEGKENLNKKEIFEGEDIFYLKEEEKKGKFRIYYENDLVMEVISNSLMEVFKLCALKQKGEARITSIKQAFYKYNRALQTGDLIEDCREENTWIFFKKDPITKLVIPIYTFKGIDKQRIYLRDILNYKFCLYALPSIRRRETTISSTIIRRTDRIKEDKKDRVICCGSLRKCLEASDKRKEYMKIRQGIRSIQEEINKYNKLIEHTTNNTYSTGKEIISLNTEEMRKLLEVCNSKKRSVNIEDILLEHKKILLIERNDLLGKSIKVLKETCTFFL